MTQKTSPALSWRSVVSAAAPVMLAYVAIGLPCGIMENKAGLTPWMVFLLSAGFYSGAGQFMIPGMLMGGSSLATIIASISFVNTRQILYSTAFAPFFTKVKRPLTLAFAASVTDESFGINLDRFEHDEGWNARKALVVNLLCWASWCLANIVGALIGPVLDLPTAILSFAMTSIFICLLVTQPMGATTILVIACTFMAVGICKLAGLSGPAIFLGAVCGVAAGLLFETIKADKDHDGQASRSQAGES